MVVVVGEKVEPVMAVEGRRGLTASEMVFLERWLGDRKKTFTKCLEKR